LGLEPVATVSLAVAAKVVYASTTSTSFVLASRSLKKLADLDIGPKRAERLTQRAGEERCAERDQGVAAYRALPLVERKSTPAGVTPPDLAVVGVDGGRLQILDRSMSSASDSHTPGSGPPAEASAAGDALETADADEAVADEQHRGKHWREDKIGLLMTMASEPSATDPCPKIPEGFVDPTRILKLTRELKTKRSASGADGLQEDTTERTENAQPLAEDEPDYEPPEVKTKKMVATRQSWKAFAPMVALAAWSLGFFAAARRAFVGDGSSNNWTLWRTHFSSFEPILDFIHGLSYVFAAAMAGRTFAEGWPVYVAWIQWAWSGEVEKVIAALAARQVKLGMPTKDEPETSPRTVVATALGYLQENKQRMRYAEYRKQGLPITSSHVESTVKQFNYRVKGTEKFWGEAGAEGILQLRGDELSDGDEMAAYWKRKEDRSTGQNRHRPAA